MTVDDSRVAAESEADFVVVGGGLAGCVVAARLSEDPEASVVLLEAGPWPADPRIERPNAWHELLGGDLDWRYATEPQHGLGGRVVAWPRGRMVGGSGAMNAMVYIRGAACDWDAWSRYGGHAWDGEGMARAFDRIESPGGHLPAPVLVTEQPHPHPLSVAFLESARACGLKPNSDFNEGEPDGVGYYRLTTDGTRRHHTAVGYLAPALSRPGLTVLPGVRACRIRLRGGRVHAVDYQAGSADRRGPVHSVLARHEVILCAGTVATPHLLMLSGIGPAQAVRAHGIDVVLDLPGVGANLHDHVQVSVSYDALGSQPVAPTSNLGEAGGFLRTGHDLPGPDVQLSFAPMKNLNQAAAIGAGFTIGPAVTRPTSRGTLTLRSADPYDPPRIDPNYLDTQHDIDGLVEGVVVARRIAAETPLADHRALGPGLDRCATESKNRADLVAFVRYRATTQFHPVGTCRFGTDELAVVDPELRLHGVEGIRVADASVIPEVTTGNIQAPVIVIAERAAQLARGGTW
jgi:choline dehydrogenase-like flavoprotein